MKKKSNHIEFKTEHGKKYDIPEEGSLGLLALGHVGLMAWREKRGAVGNLKTTNKQQAKSGIFQNKISVNR